MDQLALGRRRIIDEVIAPSPRAASSSQEAFQLNTHGNTTLETRDARSSPINKITDVYELLKRILLYLDMRDHILVQGVSWAFRRLARTSQRLRHSLFLAYIPARNPTHWMTASSEQRGRATLFSLPVQEPVRLVDWRSNHRGREAAEEFCQKHLLQDLVLEGARSVLNPLVFGTGDWKKSQGYVENGPSYPATRD